MIWMISKTIIMTDKPKNKYKCIFFYWFLYSVIFCISIWLIFGKNLMDGYSFVWGLDGTNQHIKAYQFYRSWLRDIIKTLIETHKLVIPQWNRGMGYGGDIIATLHYYVLGDPLTLTTALVPERHLVHWYDFLILLRLYLAGLSFSAFCAVKKIKSPFAILSGSMLYILSGFPLIKGFQHPFFMVPMICLPLLLIGAERILGGKSWIYFTMAVFLTLVTNFYFFYQLVIWTVFYVFVQFLIKYGVKEWRKFFSTIGRFLFSGFVGSMMAMPVFLPVFFLFTKAARKDIAHSLPILYNKEFYLDFIRSFFRYREIDYQACMGFSVVIVPLLLVFCFKKGHRNLKIIFFLMTIALGIPAVGYAFNGFSYLSIRWIYAYILILAYIGSTVLNDTWMRYEDFLKDHVIIKNALQTALLMIIILNVAWMMYQRFDANIENKGIPVAEVRQEMVAGLDRYIEEIDHEKLSPYRYSAKNELIKRNAPMVHYRPSTSYYWSLSDGIVDEFFTSLELKELAGYNYRDLDAFTFLSELACLKYYFATDKDNAILKIPYGYSYLKTVPDYRYGKNRKLRIYENKEALPFGYTYDSYMLREDFERLPSELKQEAMMENVILEENKDGLVKSSNVYDTQEIPYQLKPGKGIRIDEKNHRISVDQPGSYLTLELDGKTNCETWLKFKNLEYLTPSEVQKLDKKNLFFAILNDEGTTIQKRFRLMPEYDREYTGRKDFLMNMGWDPGKKTSIKITFESTGLYGYDEMSVFCKSMKDFQKQSAHLRQEKISEISYDVNSIHEKIKVSSDKLLCIPYTYSDGWTARVDGKKTRIEKVNIMFMGLMLSPGQHEIDLVYTTPGLKYGVILGLIGQFLFFLMLIRDLRKRRAG